MRNTVLLQAQGNTLYFPCEMHAPLTQMTLHLQGHEEKNFQLRLSHQRVDHWLYYTINTASIGKTITLEAESDSLGSIFIGNAHDAAANDEPLRPQIHLTEPQGGIPRLESLSQNRDRWVLRYEIDPFACEECNDTLMRMMSSADLLHWQKEELEERYGRKSNVANAVNEVQNWTGDVASELHCTDMEGSMHVIALSNRVNITGLPTSRVFSLPAILEDGELKPDSAIENLRIWERVWRQEPITGKFRFDMRFSVKPAEWPGISIAPATNGPNDIKADACEIDLEIMVGMEPEIWFDLAGTVWRWDALEQTLVCGLYTLPLRPQNGRLRLKLFQDRPVREAFTYNGYAMMVIEPDGIGKTTHQIHNQEIDNIQNPNFTLRYYETPYFEITTLGQTARIVELRIYALRSVYWKAENQQLLKQTEQGRMLYTTEQYTVYENCVKDQIYGEPPAWALLNGNKVLSPVRAVEEFCWRQTPWGDMTRIIDRSECWDSGDTGMYPLLESGIPVLNAAYRLSVDIMRKNVSETYALPGQAGLMNAALFQGPGEGFGIWKRDTCHNALRIQNFLAPEDIYKSLRYITRYGFDNGTDAAAMLAIAAWDHYIATGNPAILSETADAVESNADFADSLFDDGTGLIQAKHSAAQDAFEEAENEGFCLSPQIYYAHMYLCAASIFETINRQPGKSERWKLRGEQMLVTIQNRYWNEEKGCFCSGPEGSEAYQKGYWEATGAEAALWPRFGIADVTQTNTFLKTMERNPQAISDFGVNWYPFAKGKNHFWRACWVSWSLGIGVAAARAGCKELTGRLIWQQVRNVLLNKTFHEVIDFDTGRAWRWPGLPWHAAAFLGFIVYGVFGIDYTPEGLRFAPAPPKHMETMILKGVHYRNCVLDVQLYGQGDAYQVILDGKAIDEPIGIHLTGNHLVQLVPMGGEVL